MCGPMAVFDQSRQICTGPELAQPPCPQDQMDQFFVGMKPMSPQGGGGGGGGPPPSPPGIVDLVTPSTTSAPSPPPAPDTVRPSQPPTAPPTIPPQIVTQSSPPPPIPSVTIPPITQGPIETIPSEAPPTIPPVIVTQGPVEPIPPVIVTESIPTVPIVTTTQSTPIQTLPPVVVTESTTSAPPATTQAPPPTETVPPVIVTQGPPVETIPPVIVTESVPIATSPESPPPPPITTTQGPPIETLPPVVVTESTTSAPPATTQAPPPTETIPSLPTIPSGNQELIVIVTTTPQTTTSEAPPVTTPIRPEEPITSPPSPVPTEAPIVPIPPSEETPTIPPVIVTESVPIATTTQSPPVPPVIVTESTTSALPTTASSPAPVTEPIGSSTTPPPPIVVTESTSQPPPVPIDPPFIPSSEIVSGIITVGEEEEEDDDGNGGTTTTTKLQDFDIPSGSTWGVLSQGGKGSLISVTQSDGTKETITIHPGSILIAKPSGDGGKITSVTTTTGQTTTSTSVTYPPGTSYWILTVGSTGKIVKQQIWITSTTSATTVTVPTSSTVGQVQITGQQLISIGQYKFMTTQLNGGSGTIVCYGVIKRPGTTSTTITTTSTTTVMNGADEEFISGIVTTGGATFEEGSSLQLSNLTINNGDLIAVLPPGGNGMVTVLIGDTVTNFSITPGSLFAVLSSGSGSVTNLIQPQQQTWTSSVISFPAGSAISVIRVGIDGKLIRESFLQLSFPFSVLTSTGSVVGHINTSNTGSLTQIGTGSFITQNIKGTSTMVGFLQLGTITTTPSQEITECCTAATFQTLSGIVNVGDGTFMTQQVTGSANLVIAAGTTNVVVVSGTIKVMESSSSSSKETTISIPAGGLLAIVTTTGGAGGQATAIRNGHFTTNSTRFTFTSGASFSIWNILANGTNVVQNPFVTTDNTIVTVPEGSVCGQVRQSIDGVLTGIGSASFVTQNLMVSDSTGPEVPITLGSFGVVTFTERWQLSTVTISSPVAISSGNLQTIAGIVQTGSSSGVASSSTTLAQLNVPSGSSFAIIPAGGQGQLGVTDGTSSASLTVFPGQMFYLMNCQSAKVTQLVNGYFTTSSSVITFGPGTVYGVMKIGLNGQLVGLDFNRTVFNTLTIIAQPGSTVGVVQLGASGQIINSIGGASFAIKTVTTTTTSASTNIAILDNQNATTTTTTVAPPVTVTAKPTPQPPTSGPFSIECSGNALHQFPLDCSRFYQCFGEEGQRSVYIFPCAPGLIFDEKSSMCLTPAEAVCSDTSSITDLTAPSGGGGGGSSGGQVGGFFQINCSGSLFRYPLNCNNFYQCFKDDNGEESVYVFSCAGGLVFDEPQSKCLLVNETTSCESNDNLFKSPSILFGLKEPIDAENLVPNSLALFRKRFGGVEATAEVVSSPHQAGRGQERTSIKTMVDGALKAARAHDSSHQQLQQQQAFHHTQHTETTSLKIKIDHPNNFGMRIVPRSKTQRFVLHSQ